MPRIWGRICEKFPPIPATIHLVGTNGKGTTGRFLAVALQKCGLRVGHYTSPHILAFHERIWYDGGLIDDQALDETHTALLELLNDDDVATLSYFEYTTLLAILFFSSRCDWIVLEAGLGGEFDATTVFPSKQRLVVTPIGFDHCDFLGTTLEQIATTKLKAMQSDTIMAMTHDPRVMTIAQKVANDRGYHLAQPHHILNAEEMALCQAWSQKEGWVPFLCENFVLAMSVVKSILGRVSQEMLPTLQIAGRMQKLAANVLVDVGHNVMAAQQILQSLVSPRILIYNCYADKDAAEILAILAPVITRIEILDVDHERIMPRAKLEMILETLHIPFRPFEGIVGDEEYLVFGSFSVVETFIKEGYASQNL